MIFVHLLDNVLSYNLNDIPNLYQDSLSRDHVLKKHYFLLSDRHAYLYNHDNDLGSESIIPQQ